MKYFIYLLLIILLCGLNVGLAPFMQIRGQAPNFLFLLALVFALDKDNLDFVFVAVVSGLFLDFYSGAFLGSFTFSLLFICFLLKFLVQNFLAFELNLKILSLVLVAAQILLYVGFAAYNWLLYNFNLVASQPGWQNLPTNFLIALVYNLVFLYPVYFLFSFVKTILAKYVVREYKIR